MRKVLDGKCPMFESVQHLFFYSRGDFSVSKTVVMSVFFWFSCLVPDDCSAVSIFLVIERVSVFCKLFMLLVPTIAIQTILYNSN